MKINIDTDIKTLIVDGADIAIRQEAEEAILKLYEAKAQIEQAIDDLKFNIANELSKLEVNVSTIKTSKLKVMYRSYGSRYILERAYLDQIPQDLYTTKVSYAVDTKKVDQFVDEKGGLPLGIQEVDRPKTLSITIKDDKTED